MLIFCAVWFWTGRMPPSIVEATRSQLKKINWLIALQLFTKP